MQQTLQDTQKDLLEFVAQNRGGLREIEDPDLSQHIVFQLADREGFLDALIRIVFSHHADTLFRALFTHASDGGRFESFVDAVFGLPLEYWTRLEAKTKHGISAEAVAQTVLPNLDQLRFLETYADPLCREEHPLFRLVDPDPYWKTRVLAFANGGSHEDLFRGWSAIKDAHNGLKIHSKETVPETSRCHRATLECQKDLIRLLYSALVRTGLIERLVSDECFPNVSYSIVSIEPLHSPRKGQQKRLIKILSVHLGLEMAINLDRGWLSTDRLVKPKHGDFITPEAAMVLKLAAYFQK